MLLLLFSCTTEKPTDDAAPADSETDTRTDGSGTDDSAPDSGADDSGADDSDDSDTGTAVLPCPDDLTPALSTTSGCVVGAPYDHGEAFLGVPFAQPPVGDLRWRRPLPALPWAEPLIADAHGPACVQSADSFFGDMVAGDGSEDCLYLDIYRPAGASPGQGLPILFFTHGGGNATGSGAEESFLDPALGGEAIVITHNYRLGAFGWLGHAALSAEDPDGVSGNYGLLDTILALQWVRDNAEVLGGDPDQILAFGESAGAVDTCALLIAPEADGLFAAAALQSGPCFAVHEPLRGGSADQGEGYGAALQDQLGCDGDPDPAACMRTIPAADIVAAAPAAVGPLSGGHRFGPLVDGVIVPRSGIDAIRFGAFSRVPVLSGSNADEATIFTAGLVQGWADAEALIRALARAYGFDPDAVWDRYDQDAGYPDGPAAFDAFYADVLFTCPTRYQSDALAAWTESRAYRFDYAPAWAAGYGAFHGAEIPYVFGSRLARLDDPALSALMRAAWASLPAQPEIPGLGPWPALDPADPEAEAWIAWEAGAASASSPPRQEDCDWWATQGLDPW